MRVIQNVTGARAGNGSKIGAEDYVDGLIFIHLPIHELLPTIADHA